MSGSLEHDRLVGKLVREGWCVAPRAAEPSVIAALECDLAPRFAATPYCEGVFYGARTKRFGGLLKRSPQIDPVQIEDVVIGCAFPEGEQGMNMARMVSLRAGLPESVPAERDFRAVRVRGTLPTDLVGILLSIAGPLAQSGIPIFAISTFDTDYVLFKAARLEEAMAALAAAGHTVTSGSTPR